MQAGDQAVVTIASIAAGGDGVARLDGMAVFVPGTCPGERVEIELVRVKSGCAYGRLLRILEPSPCRRYDFCEAAGRCGGCDFAHMTYSEQLVAKRQIVVDALQRIGGFRDIEVAETLGAERPERYRNKMVFPLGKIGKGKIAGGFYAPGSHQLVPLSDCRQGDSAASAWLKETVSFLEEQHISVYDEALHRGVARRLFVRLAEGTKEAMVVLTVNGDMLRNSEELVRRLLAVKTSYRLKSILLNIHKEPNNLLLGKQNKVLYGREYIEDVLGGLSFRISAHSFYQINSPQTQVLYQTALDLAELSGGETVLDLYCGIGTISLFAASRAGRVIGVEVVSQAIQNAKENAERNGIDSAEFLLGKAEELAPQLTHEKPSVVFLDPPRKGAEQSALDAIITMAPPRVVYVSCNPATLARDARYLCEHGYQLTKAIPVDMFPNTSHIEAVAQLQLSLPDGK